MDYQIENKFQKSLFYKAGYCIFKLKNSPRKYHCVLEFNIMDLNQPFNSHLIKMKILQCYYNKFWMEM